MLVVTGRSGNQEDMLPFALLMGDSKNSAKPCHFSSLTKLVELHDSP